MASTHLHMWRGIFCSAIKLEFDLFGLLFLLYSIGLLFCPASLLLAWLEGIVIICIQSYISDNCYSI